MVARRLRVTDYSSARARWGPLIPLAPGDGACVHVVHVATYAIGWARASTTVCGGCVAVCQ